MKVVIKRTLGVLWIGGGLTALFYAAGGWKMVLAGAACFGVVAACFGFVAVALWLMESN